VAKFPRRIGFWFRAAATAIDLVLIIIACIIVLGVTYAIQSGFVTSLLGDDERIYTFTWYALLIIFFSLEIFFVATPGKLILGLCVANANGTPAPRSMRFHRWITKTWCFWLSIAAVISDNMALNLYGTISYTMLLAGCLGAANDYRQAWHDEIAGTAVFRRRDIYRPRPTARGSAMVPPPLPSQS